MVELFRIYKHISKYIKYNFANGKTVQTQRSVNNNYALSECFGHCHPCWQLFSIQSALLELILSSDIRHMEERHSWRWYVCWAEIWTLNLSMMSQVNEPLNLGTQTAVIIVQESSFSLHSNEVKEYKFLSTVKTANLQILQVVHMFHAWYKLKIRIYFGQNSLSCMII